VSHRLGTLAVVPISSDLLDDGEDVLIDLRPHWAFLFAPVSLLALAIATAALVSVEFPHAPSPVSGILAVVVVVPAFWAVGRTARWLSTSLIVTDRRIVFRRGVLRRDVTHLRLQRIVDIHCSQTVLQRIIGSGKLIVEVEGEEGGISVEDVRRPRALQRVLTRQIDNIDRSDGMGSPGYEQESVAEPRMRHAMREPGSFTPPQGVEVSASRAPAHGRVESSGVSVPEQLIQLDQLRRRGILTEAEFAEKKAELLDRL